MIRLRPSGADEVLIKRVRDWYEPGPGVFIAPQALFNPALLFTTGVNGTWYDPSDLNTLFQDAAGTTPVTSVEQPVGLMKDKSGRGNHAFNSSGNSANFPVLSARYNLLTNSEASGAIVGNPGVMPVGWSIAQTPAGCSTQIVATGTINGVAYCDIRLTGTTLNNNALLIQAPFVTVLAASYTMSFSLAVVGGSLPSTLGLSGGGALGSSFTAVSVGSSLTRVSANWSLSAGTLYPWIQISVSNGVAVDVTLRFAAADLRVSNDALNQPAYQRVNTATDYDTVGFKPYLRFNGTNQWLQTNSIDFSYGDNMFVCAGVRKLSDAALGIVTELSADTNVNNGTLYFIAPAGTVSPSYAFASKGTVSIRPFSSGFAAPITNVVSGICDISAPSATLRVNGTQVAQSIASQGTGNYGNYPLYIGARAGSSLWFNGRLHQLVVAGKQASASEIGQTEAFTNTKTGAY